MKKCNKCKRILTENDFHKNYKVCKECTNKYNREYRRKNLQKVRETDKKRRERVKLDALKLLSQSDKPFCKVCGFDDELGLLQVDHINNDGFNDKGSWGRRRKGSHMYAKILRMSPNEARKKYRTLCVFHNWARRYGKTGEEYSVVVVDGNDD